MKIKYLGTAAAEGIPAIFCDCDTCREAREKKGPYIRTRSQALIDGKLLIDFNADTYYHTLKYDIELSKIKNCLITHSHGDHLYPAELSNRKPGFAHLKDNSPLNFYGSEAVFNEMKKVLFDADGKNVPYASFTKVKPFDVFKAGEYTVSAMPARHSEKSGPLFYIIEKGGKTLLYGHDTGYYFDEVWEYFKKKKLHFDLVSLDCTEAMRHIEYVTHSNVERDILIRKRMLDEGYADGKTVFVLNHFSHNGADVGYDKLNKNASELGFAVSYDGMEIEF